MNKRIFAAFVILAVAMPPSEALAHRWKSSDRRNFAASGRSSSSQNQAFLRNVRHIQHKQRLADLQRRTEHEDRRFQAVVPNDPYYHSTGSWGQSYSDLWGIKKIGLDKNVWSISKGEGVKIAFVDTGVQASHEDLASNIYTDPLEIPGNGIDDEGDGFIDDVHGWDFVDADNDPDDLNGHGTHVAGVAAAVGNNAKGIIGVAPKAKIIPVRVFDASGASTVQRVADGIRYAAQAGAHIINLSIATPGLSTGAQSILQSAVHYARSLGSILVAAAGNGGQDVNGYSPANLDGVLAIGATGPDDGQAVFSNFGDQIFLTAPGIDILSTGSEAAHLGEPVSNGYYIATGTSDAAPFVSGAIALLLSKRPGATFEAVREALRKGAKDLGEPGWDPQFGYGRLNIAASLGVRAAVPCMRHAKKKWHDLIKY